MTKLFGILFSVTVVCIPCAARQQNTSTEGPKTNQSLQIKQINESPITPIKSENQRRILGSLPAGFVVAELKWVVKDGLVYLDMLGNGKLLPVPGGGASGCFDLNLEERLSKLGTRIQAFPPQK